ncbi:MAG: hypothetical protein ACE5FE_01870, partial [Acidiferrobacterales bacterium]
VSLFVLLCIVVLTCSTPQPPPPNPIERMLTGEAVAEPWFLEFMRRVRAGEDPGAVADDLIARGLILPEMRLFLVNAVAPHVVYPVSRMPDDPIAQPTAVAQQPIS